MPSRFATGVQAQAQPIIRKHGLIEGLAPARPDGGKHECVFLGRRALSTPFVDGLAHRFNYAATMMPLRLPRCRIGEINVVVDLPAAGRGRYHAASLITRASLEPSSSSLPRWL